MKTMVFKTFNRKTIARLLSHEDEQGMGRVFMYAFVNEVIRQKRPFPFDCESAQVNPNLMIVDKQGRSISVKHKHNRLSLTLNGQCAEGLTRIEYEGKAYRQAILDWLAACIQHTSLQPELRKELKRYARSIQRKSSKKQACALIWHRIFVYLQRQIHHTHGKSNCYIPNRQWTDCY